MNSRLKANIINTTSIILIYIILVLLIRIGFINNYYEGILIEMGINIILAVSLNLATGYLGQLTLGHAGFMAIGAYTAAILSARMNLPDLPLLLVSIVLGGLLAAFFAFLMAIPVFRLRGDYLAILTLGFGEIIRVIILNMKITGGGKGLSGILPLTSFSTVYFITVITVTIFYTLINSRHGRAIISIREDEIAAEAVGISTKYYKTFAFTLAAFFAGVAGGLFAHHTLVLDPKDFNFIRSIEILIIVVLGGMGNLTGSVLAAIIITILPRLLMGFADWNMIIYSVLLIAMMLFKPGGLLEKREFSLNRLLSGKKKSQGNTPVKNEGSE
ncbi:MAG TPA: branched-chain amino acid ABC transporter permease [Defluviitaleaceae bacterium]|nr:branched-chain amino acid ABC transporter permease [Defluviitaleaceae bacterium]